MVNLHDAKTQLSRLVDDAAAGAEIIIAKAGKPCARLVPLPLPPTNRRLGLLKGKVDIRADFDAPLPDDIGRTFEE
jgi:prevent-host-death family protein